MMNITSLRCHFLNSYWGCDDDILFETMRISTVRLNSTKDWILTKQPVFIIPEIMNSYIFYAEY